MTFQNEQDYRQWLALVLAAQQQLLRAREIAEKAAFADLPPEEQRRYIAFAVQALKEKEFLS